MSKLSDKIESIIKDTQLDWQQYWDKVKLDNRMVELNVPPAPLSSLRPSGRAYPKPNRDSHKLTGK